MNPQDHDFRIMTDNTAPRLPLLLLLDTSYSMEGEKIRALNKGLQTFKEEIVKDERARMTLEIALVTFGGSVQLLQPFTLASQWTPPTLSANGNTPMGQAIEMAIPLIDQRMDELKNKEAVGHYHPWLWLMTDGQPTDAVQRATQMMKDFGARHRIRPFAVGVGEDADMEALTRICPRLPLKLDGLKFEEMFRWLSSSIIIASHTIASHTTPQAPSVETSPQFGLNPVDDWAKL